MTVSIFVASSGRPRMLHDMLASIHETTHGKFDIEVILVIDADYVSRDEFCNWGFVNIVDFSSERRGALWSWNRALQLSSGDILVPAGDDQKFYPNWLDYALESHQEKLGAYGVVGMNDLAYNGNTQVATMFLFDRQYCKDHMGGIFAPPLYHYYCVDLEWNEKAKMLGKFYWDERAVVEHLHSAHGKRPVDETDKLKDDSWMATDNEIFEIRRRQGFPVAWSPII